MGNVIEPEIYLYIPIKLCGLISDFDAFRNWTILMTFTLS